MATAKHKENKKQISAELPFYKKHAMPLVMFGFAFLLYANTISNDYNLDDELVTRNHKFTSKGLSALPEIFTSPYYSDDMGYSYDYRPMVHTSFAIEHQFFGESPHISHFFNVLLFAVLCALLYMLLRAMLPAPDIIIILAVALFAAHPIHTEVIASIKNRDELLMFLFSAGALYLLIKWIETRYIAAITACTILFIFSLLSKSTALPFAILIPASIIFFRKVSFKQYLTLSLLLGITAVLFINNTQLLFKLQVSFAIIFANLLIYCLVAFIRNNEQIKIELKKISQGFESVRSQVQSISEKFSLSTKFPNTILAVLATAILYISIAAGCYSLFFSITWLFCASAVICTGYFLLLPYRNSIWAIVPVFALILLALHKYDVYWVTVYNIVFIYLLSLIYYSSSGWHRNFWISLAIVFLVFVAISHRELPLIILLPFIGIYFPRYKKPSIIISGIVLAVVIIMDVYYMPREGLSIGSPINVASVIFSMLWHYRSLRPQHYFRIMALVFIGLLSFEVYTYTPKHNFIQPNLFTISKQDKYKIAGQRITTSFSQIQNVTVPGPVSVSTERPLNFVETPVPLSAPLSIRIINAFDVFLRYAKLLVVPHPLLFYYGYKVIEPINTLTPSVVFSILLHLALIIFALICVKHRPIVSWALIFYMAFIASVGNIFISIPGGIGERYLFVPSLAFCVLLAWIIVAIAAYILKIQPNGIGYKNNTVKWVAIPLIVIYSMATLYRNSLWKDDITLFTHDVKNAPGSAQAHNLLAIHLIQKSFTLTNPNEQTEIRKEALGHLKESNRIYPKMFNVAYDIGRAYALLNMADSAVVAFQYASTLDTNFYNIQLSIAEIYFSQAKYDDAIPYLQYMIRKLPDYYPSYEKLSYIYFLKKEYNNSVELNRQAITRMPNTPEPYINIVRTFIGINNIDSARHYALQAYKIAPQNSMTQQMVQQLGIKP